MIAVNKDVASGGAVFAFGAAYAAHAAATLQLGTFAAMGPGMFPLCIGTLMAGIGAWMLGSEIVRQLANRGPAAEPWQPIEWRSLIAVISGMAAFAVAITFFGVIPAIFAVAGVSALASDKLKPLTVLILSTCLSVAAWAIFTVALRLPLSLFAWPF